MERNVGGYDRIARLILGPILVIVAAAAFGGYVTVASGFVGAALLWVALLLGAALIVTGTTQKCVLNGLLGFDTFRDKSEESTSDSDSGSGRPMQ